MSTLTFIQPRQSKVDQGNKHPTGVQPDVLPVQAVLGRGTGGPADQHVAPVQVSVLELQRIFRHGERQRNLPENTERFRVGSELEALQVSATVGKFKHDE